MFTAFPTPHAGAGAHDGPRAVDSYKSAVYRPPPTKFIVDILTPEKQGSQHSYGMKITPMLRGDRSSISSGDSKSSNKSTNVEYEIWRRWEDCLWFQDTLELEYSRLARMKRQRLLAGKGVKRDGFYLQDRASSWESLPPGPEANSVAKDIHEIIPKLTKKGTLFRASQATIEQRQREIVAFVEALFADDVPSLVAELRADRKFTDFFGYWRRDHELALKNEARSPAGKTLKPRTSITSSVLSSYFSTQGDNTDTASVRRSIASTSPSSPSARSSRISVITEASQYARALRLRDKQKQKEEHMETTSTLSSSTSSSGSSTHSRNSMASTIPGIREEVPLTFDHNPQVTSQKDRFLQSLPEDAELSTHSDSESVPPSIRRPKKRSSRDTLYRRSARIFTAPPNTNEISDGLQTPTVAQWSRGLRESWQTTDSASTYLEGLGYTIPPSPPHIFHPSRLSIGSIATFMTDTSADAVIPRNSIPNTPAQRSSAVRRSRPVSIYSVTDGGSWSDGDESVLDSYIFDAFPMPAHLFPSREGRDNEDKAEDDDSSASSESRPETPLGHLPFIPDSPLRIEIPARPQSIPEDITSVVPRSPDLASPIGDVQFLPVPPSPTASTTSTEFSCFTAMSDASTVSTSTAATSVLTGTLTIKAAHNQSIILLRTIREAEFSDIRERIYDKFLTQEKITLTEAFALAFILQDEATMSPVGKGKGRARSNSVGGGSSKMILITNQADWERALATTNSSKVTVRVLDTFHEEAKF
ncbi:hypothetical protein BDP27DRAFT_1326208 [Rhodocollybia butyracea]|uniref:PX domain-containing protein n=1 Tax=Rhodocollybia butyracea TaxID=206335 RepID=A0A9P5PUX9_9AGAR|nr:hypothetical protein BDP27DRAFT_1326208 [Rhodocollybia butyracea]